MTIIVKWFGHASFMAKAAGLTIYIDPHEGEYMEKADVILSTHSPADHCNISKIGLIRKEDTKIVATEEGATKIGRKVDTIAPGGQVSID